MIKLLTTLIFLFTTSISLAESCEELATLQALHEGLALSQSPLDSINFIKEIRLTEKENAESILDNYHIGGFNLSFYENCLNDEIYLRLKDRISDGLKKRSISDLKNSSSDLANLLAKTVTNSPKLFIFQAKFGDDFNDRPAEYQRMSGAMYYDLAAIPASDFKLILVHELLHKVDEEVLYSTSVDFSDEDTNNYLFELASSTVSYNSLSSKDKDLLSQYVLNGLRRGFLAEFKAWAASYSIYNELTDAGEIGSVDWADEILSQQKDSESYLDFIFNYYIENFSRPKKESLFQWDLLQEAYDIEIKKMTDIKDKCELMDDLAIFIKECDAKYE